MARPPDLSIVCHSSIIQKPPVLRKVNGGVRPCQELVCPSCKESRWVQTNRLREFAKRESFTGHCRRCGQDKRTRRSRANCNSKKQGRSLTTNGYVEIRLAAIDDNDIALFDKMKSKLRAVSEHRWVMAKHLERPLTENETVHHKNGITTDNRIENLELWTSSHPPGQRIEDCVLWAKEFVAQYGSEFPE